MTPLRHILFFQLFVLLPAYAEETPILLSTDDAIRMAFRNNRELAIASLEIRRAESRFKWSGRLDNPELELEASTDQIGLDEDESNYSVAFSQSFPLTSRLRDEKFLRQSQVLLAEAEVAEQRRKLAAKVDRSLAALVVTQQKITLRKELVNLNTEIVDFLTQRSKLGEISAFEVTQAALTGRTLDQQVTALKAEANRQRLALNRALGVAPDSTFGFSGNASLPKSPPEAKVDLKTIISTRPDYVLAFEKIDESDAAIALEKAKRWEDVSIRLFLERENAVDEPSGLERNSFAGIGVSIPLPIRQRNEDGIAQAEIDREAAEKSVDALAFMIESEYAAAHQDLLATYEMAKATSGEVLGLAKKNLEDFRTAYQQGQASLLQVQRAQEQLLEIRVAALEALAAYHIAAAEVRFVTGDYPELNLEK